VAGEFRVAGVEDEGHALRAGPLRVGDEKVAADVQLAAVFFIKAGGFLDVVVDGVFGDRQAVVLRDPVFFFRRGVFEIDPDGLEARQLFKRFDFFLKQPPVGQRDDVEQGTGSLGVVGGAGAAGGVWLSAPRAPAVPRETKAGDWGRVPRRCFRVA
jgi:hypothetical protein